MKKIVLFVFGALCLSSLSSCKLALIGSLTTISTRSVNDDLDYCLVASDVNSTKKEQKRKANRAENLDRAMDLALRSVPGGEFMKNARIYKAKWPTKRPYVISGDVWGYCDRTLNEHKGFTVGDNVIWREGVTYKRGKIAAYKSHDKCIVESEEGDLRTVRYTDLSRAEE